MEMTDPNFPLPTPNALVVKLLKYFNWDSFTLGLEYFSKLANRKDFNLVRWCKCTTQIVECSHQQTTSPQLISLIFYFGIIFPMQYFAHFYIQVMAIRTMIL